MVFNRFRRKNLLKLAGIGVLGSIILGYAFSNKKSASSNEGIPAEKSLERRMFYSSPDKSEDKKLPSEYSLDELNKFNSWIDSTLAESAREGSNSVIVNKKDKMLYLIKKGKVDSKYNVDLGKSPYEDKQKEGDYRTPEGRYTVIRKLNSSEFYKAFLINYPNSEDKAKGKTGGLIEIHGKGGKGYNWTWGCIALSNEDIDKIFPYLNKGDGITIVRYDSKNLFPQDSIIPY